VASVYGTPVTVEELDCAVSAHLARRGQKVGEISRQHLRGTRVTVLEKLVEDRILATFTKSEIIPLPDGAVEEEIARIRKGFSSGAAFQSYLDSHGMDATELRKRVRERLRHLTWIEEKIAPATDVSDGEVRAFFDKHHASLRVPESTHARHIFLSTVENPDRENEINDLHRRLVADPSRFAALAEEFSEDENSKQRGGDLGTFSKDRISADFAEATWAISPGTLGEPVRTRIGWHIIGVLARTPARDSTFDELSPEIRTHLVSQKRTAAIQALKDQLRLRAGEHLQYRYDTLFPKPPGTSSPEHIFR